VKKLTIFLFGIFVILVSILYTQNKVSAKPDDDFVAGQILVKFKESVSPSEVDQIHKKLGGKVKKTIPQISVQVVNIGNKNVGEIVSAYARDGRVEYVEPNYIASALTSDKFFDRQWGLHNIGQEEGISDADIDAPEAWQIEPGNSTMLIAILDSGIDQDHPDLMGKITANNDFTGSGTVNDFYGHGTHVAGIAAANTDNGIGVAGIGYQSRLLNGKVLNDQGLGAYSWIAEGIFWAVDQGAKVINLSLGGSRKSVTLEDAVNHAWENNVVVVAAAGNSGNTRKLYPAYYQNCIAVAATDNNDIKASFSSYGSWVDVAAPGENIFSTFPNHPFYIETAYERSQEYDFANGTSMSSPFVAGIAALVWNTEYGNDAQSVRNQIEETADAIPGTGLYWQWGRVNACNAVGGDCSSSTPQPSSTPTPEPSPTATPTPDPGCLSCFKDVCDGRCHPKEIGTGCPDCKL
jgi:thermitase